MDTIQQNDHPMFDQNTSDLIQKEFFRLQNVVFLNAALASVLPVCVEKAYQEEQSRYQNNYASEENWEEEKQQARAGIAKLIGAKTRNIALLSNTVEGMGIIVRDYPWDRNMNIVTYSSEHPSNLLPTILGSRKGDYKLKTIDLQNESLTTSKILETIDRGTQAVVCSAVQFSDGARIDIRALGQECQRRGILLIADGIQAIGRMNVDVKEAGIDFLACGCHKGLLVRNGIGFVYCSDKLMERLNLSTGAIQSISGSIRKCACDPNEPIPWLEDARRLENGNRNHPGVCGLIASTGLINQIGIMKIENQILGLQDELFRQLGSDACRVKPHGDMPSGIVRADFPASKIEKVTTLLSENKIYATIRPDNMRFCIGIYNTVDQMRVLASVIQQIHELKA